MLQKQRKSWRGRCIKVDCENEIFTSQMTEGKGLWGREVVCTHWNRGGQNALGEPTHDSSVEGVWMWGLETGERGVKEFPTTFSVLVYSLWRANPSPSWGPQAESNGTLPKDMEAGRTRSQTCLLPPMWIFCSLQFAFDFGQVSGHCPHLSPPGDSGLSPLTESWFWALL